MLYLSKLLSRDYVYDAVSLTTTLTLHGVRFQYVLNTHDIWLRDFMPVQTRTRQLVSFRYEPSYLTKFPKLRTDFRRDIAQSFGCSVVYSDINLDGGNVVFSPSKETAVISDRIFSENPAVPRKKLVDELERVADAAIFMKESHLVDICGVEELRMAQKKSVVDRYREIYGHGGEQTWEN